MTADDLQDPAFEQLLVFMRDQRGFDFTGYKRQSLRRRTDKRMADVGVTGYAAYRQHLEVTPEEFPRLFDTILINVTRFFRDPDVWDVLQTEILPRHLGTLGSDDVLRVWTAGCASGEEAYTLTMVLAELMGVSAVRDRVKVYATDVDEDALATARKALYAPDSAEDVPEPLRSRYLVPADGMFAVHPDLRRAVVFGRHDLLRDAPIGRIDLLTCRNTLMYFNAETQAHVVGRLHFALKDSGIMLLGRVETLLSHAALFETIDLPQRAFRKVVSSDLRDRLRGVAADVSAERPDPRLAEERLRAMVDAGPAAQLLIDADRVVVTTNRQARSMFGLTVGDHGRLFHDLELSYHPVELRSWIDRATTERRSLALDDVAWSRPGHPDRHLAVEVTPRGEGAGRLGVVLTIQDRSDIRQLEHELTTANRQLEAVHEELRSTNEALETANEELQSANEELETTNEELQSTNEELETMNVELQATNEQLHEINAELQRRSDDLDDVNGFLESILGHLDGGVAVLDRDLVVSMWNDHLVDLWGLRQDEAIGRSLADLDFGLPVEDLAEPVAQVLAGSTPQVRCQLPGRNRLGRAVMVDVTCGPLRDHRRGTRGVIVRMVPTDEERS